MRQPAASVASRILRGLGTLAAVLCLALLGYRIAVTSGQMPRELWSLELAGRLSAATACYLVGLAALSLGWHRLLQSRGLSPSRADVLSAAFLAQVGKYLPGNVGHYVGRVELLRGRGVDVAGGIRALAGEAAVMIGLACAGLPFIPPLPAGQPVWLELVVAWLRKPGVAAGAGVVLVLAGLRLAAGSGSPHVARRLGLAAWLKAAGAVVPYAGYLLFQGLGLWWLGRAFGLALPAVSLVAVFAVAWMVGFVVLGAPAGLGVRDVLMVALLTTSMPEPTGLALCLCHRWAVTAGDGAAFLLGAAVRRATGPVTAESMSEHEELVGAAEESAAADQA